MAQLLGARNTRLSTMPESARRNRAAAAVMMPLVLVLALGCTSVPDVQPDEAAPSVSQQLDEKWAAFSAIYPEVTRPTVEVVEVLNLENWAETIATCLVDEGFSVNVTPDNGLEWSAVPEAQQQSFALAQYVCDARYPLNPKLNVPLDGEQLTELYDYFADELVPCLESEGFAISAMPSRQAFIDDYYTERSWSPYSDVVGNVESDDRWHEINEACPQEPGTLYD